MEKEIRVWDPLVRIFHWSLVLAFTIGYLSGDEENDLHIYAGYVVLGLITFRLIWGFIGTPYARFKDFLRTPQTIITYIKELIAGRAKRYIGHNPAAGAMIIALLLGLFVVSYSGLKVYAIEEGAGPLAQQTMEISIISPAYADDDDDEHEGKHEEEGDEDFWEEVHEVSTNFVLFLVVLHIAGVLISSKLHKENLVRAMISGKKKVK
jgi:cytochrome b